MHKSNHWRKLIFFDETESGKPLSLCTHKLLLRKNQPLHMQRCQASRRIKYNLAMRVDTHVNNTRDNVC